MYRNKGIRNRWFGVLLHPSKIRLPETEKINEEFGEIEYRNGKENVKGKHTYGLASVMYDVLIK